jgi:hypothetical protein
MPEQKKIIGVLSHCENDVINKIDKRCVDTGFDFWADERFLMPHSFKAEAIARDGDEFNEEVGKEIVRQKIMKRYYSSYDKRVDLFKCMIANLSRKVDRK